MGQKLDFRRFVSNLYRGLLHREPDAEGLAHWTKVLERGLDLNAAIEQIMAGEEFGNTLKDASNLFVAPGHFYSPIVNVEEVTWLFGDNSASPPESLPGIAIDKKGMLETWRQLLPYLKSTPFPAEKLPEYRYYFENPAFSYADGSILSAMLRHFRPSRLIEIGSGYSSACAMDTIDLYLNGEVAVTFIEPYPELLLDLLGKKSAQRVTIEAAGVQKVDLGLFAQLQAGDFLFIDSTHVLKTGSDVCHELFTVLPSLNAGVFVHFHDIFWPFEYGAEWVLAQNRSWNELYGLRAFLMYNDLFEVVFFNDYFVRHCRDAAETDYPAFLRNSGGSIWLRKK